MRQQYLAESIQYLVYVLQAWTRIVLIATDLQAVHSKGRKAKCPGFSIRVERVIRCAFELWHRDKDRIPAELVTIDPVLEVRPVNIRRIEVERGRRDAIGLQVVGIRAAARILARSLRRRR